MKFHKNTKVQSMMNIYYHLILKKTGKLKDLVFIFFCVIINKTNQLSRQVEIPSIISLIRFSCVLPPKSSYALLFSSVQLLSHVWLFAIPWTAARQASLSITNFWRLLKLVSIESVMPSNQLIPCHPLLLLASVFPSIKVFSNESVLCIRWPKYWSFSFNIGPSNEHPGLISFTMDWLDLLAVQGTLKSLLQHHSSKASILRCSAFFTVQLSQPYMTTGKIIAVTRRTFVGKVSFCFLICCLGWS